MNQSRRDFLRWTRLGAAGLSIPLPWWMKFFQPQGRSMIAVPANYGEILPVTLTSREDLLDVIQMIAPYETPLIQLLRSQPHADRMMHEWITDELEGVVAAKNVVRFMPR